MVLEGVLGYLRRWGLLCFWVMRGGAVRLLFEWGIKTLGNNPRAGGK